MRLREVDGHYTTISWAWGRQPFKQIGSILRCLSELVPMLALPGCTFGFVVRPGLLKGVEKVKKARNILFCVVFIGFQPIDKLDARTCYHAHHPSNVRNMPKTDAIRNRDAVRNRDAIRNRDGQK